MRVSLEKIRKKREKKESVFLVTGATGFLGSHTTVELLKKGYRVVLIIRPDGNCSASERINNLFKWFRVSIDEFKDKVKIIEGMLEKDDLGIDEETYSYLSSNIDEIIHCAGNTSFSEKKRGDLESTNIWILGNLTKIIDSPGSRCSFFHHVSTVYVAGKFEGPIYETILDTDKFNNPYEETKHLGEKYISEKTTELEIHLNIYRPSIVYGNSETGKSTIFNAVYYPVKMALFLRDTYVNDIRHKGGIKASRMGVKEDKEGIIHLPIRIKKVAGGEINLIPIDFYINSFMAIMESGPEPGIFHIVNNSPNSLEDITNFFSTEFRVKSFHSASKEEFEKNPPNALDILFSEYLKMYGPYIRDKRKFDDRRTRSILDNFNIHCPRFDQKIFSKCMNYAVSVNWKKPW